MTEEGKSENRPQTLEAGSETSAPSAGDLFAKTVKSVCDGVVRAAKETGNDALRALDAITGVVQSSVRGAVEAGSNLVLGAKAIVVGVLRGTGEKEAAALKTLSNTSRAVIRHTAKLGGDLAASVKGLILGAIASAKDMGVDRVQTATSAAQGALEGAEEAGSAAAETVRGALKEDIGGIKVALPQPLRK
ncbi:MAG TPA: hypothetical protein VJB14_03795 [Planctomycetota bacterium]|nr:hypothetical protein [Planctomycetota bacterium]